MNYFSHMASSYSAKNKLQEAIKAYMAGKNRKVISEAELPDFKADILRAIENLNRAHKNCTPVNASWSVSSVEQDHHLNLRESIIGNFVIYKGKN